MPQDDTGDEVYRRPYSAGAVAGLLKLRCTQLIMALALVAANAERATRQQEGITR